MKLVKTEKTQEILDYLKENEIVNLNIIGKIENNPDLPIFTDNAQNPSGVFVKSGYIHFVYTESEDFIKAIHSQHMADGFFGFAGLEANLAQRMKKGKNVMWSNPCSIYAYTKDHVEPAKGSYDLRPIAYEDAEIVDKYYEYRDDHSIHDIRKDIKNRPSSAVYVNDEPVCWVLVHEDNSMGIMYTKEEHRRKGLAEVVSRDLTRRILENGQIPYLQIVDGNEKSHGLAKKCGFEKVGACEWFGIIAGQPKEFIEMGEIALKSFKKTYKQDRFSQGQTLSVEYFSLNWLKEAEADGMVARKLSDKDDFSQWAKLIKQAPVKEAKDRMDAWVVEYEGRLVGAALMETPVEDEEDYTIHALKIEKNEDVQKVGQTLLKAFKDMGKYFIFSVVDQEASNGLKKIGFKTGNHITL